MPGSSIDRTWHLSRWQTLLFAVAGFAIALAGLLAWRESRAAVSAVASVQHTFSVLLRIDRLRGFRTARPRWRPASTPISRSRWSSVR